MAMKGILFGVLIVSLAGTRSGLGQNTSVEITADELKAHVKYLASDELEGRKSGTIGNEKAAEYLVQQFRLYGLKPAGERGTYLQPFEFISAVKLGVKNSFVVRHAGTNTTLKPDEDFRPLGFSSSEEVSGELAFAGYGISAPDKNYDDYAGVDVNGKLVIALRYGPDGNDPHSDFNRFTSLRNKARSARDKGAKALIMVTGPNDEESDELMKLSYDNSFASSGIVAISVKREALEPFLKMQGRSLKALQDAIKETKKPMSSSLTGVNATIRSDVEKVMSRTANVVGYLEGTDTRLKDEVEIIGAHFDHLGYGGPGSGSLMPDTSAVHNGADDNASGTSSLLELAQAFAAHTSALKRTLLFIGFSGEELGTLGSAYYVNNPFFPLDRTVAMINMDEVGRLHNSTLTVYGTGTSPAWPPLLTKFNSPPTISDTFSLKLVPDGFGPSDHAQFYGKDIPVLFFFTGTHNDYHKPSDDWQTLNYSGQENLTRYIYSLAKEIQGQPARPQFSRAASSAPMGGGDSRGFAVTLGVIPDYGESSDGMKIGGTRPNGPAEKAGLKSGDTIVKLAGKKVMNIYDYMGILGELKADQEVEVEVKREGKHMTFTAKMQKR